MEQQRTVNIIQYHVTTPQSINILSRDYCNIKRYNTYVCAVSSYIPCSAANPLHLPKTSAVNTEVTSLRKIVSEAVSRLRSHRDRDPRPNKPLMGSVSDRTGRAADSHFGRFARNQLRLSPAKDFPWLCKNSIDCFP